MNLGIIAHNSKKVLIEDFCIAYKNILEKQQKNTREKIRELQYIDKKIENRLKQLSDSLNTVYDKMDPKEPDITNIVKKCDQYNIPVATNIATAELLILGLARGDLDWRLNLK